MGTRPFPVGLGCVLFVTLISSLQAGETTSPMDALKARLSSGEDLGKVRAALEEYLVEAEDGPKRREAAKLLARIAFLETGSLRETELALLRKNALDGLRSAFGVTARLPELAREAESGRNRLRLLIPPQTLSDPKHFPKIAKTAGKLETTQSSITSSQLTVRVNPVEEAAISRTLLVSKGASIRAPGKAELPSPTSEKVLAVHHPQTAAIEPARAEAKTVSVVTAKQSPLATPTASATKPPAMDVKVSAISEMKVTLAVHASSASALPAGAKSLPHVVSLQNLKEIHSSVSNVALARIAVQAAAMDGERLARHKPSIQANPIRTPTAGSSTLAAVSVADSQRGGGQNPIALKPISLATAPAIPGSALAATASTVNMPKSAAIHAVAIAPGEANPSPGAAEIHASTPKVMETPVAAAASFSCHSSEIPVPSSISSSAAWTSVQPKAILATSAGAIQPTGIDISPAPVDVATFYRPQLSSIQPQSLGLPLPATNADPGKRLMATGHPFQLPSQSRDKTSQASADLELATRTDARFSVPRFGELSIQRSAGEDPFLPMAKVMAKRDGRKEEFAGLRLPHHEKSLLLSLLEKDLAPSRLDENGLERALAACAEALSKPLDKKTASVLGMQAWECYRRRYPEKNFDTFSSWLSEHTGPGSLDSGLTMARLANDAGDFDKCLRLLQPFLDDENPGPDCLLLAGIAYAKTGQAEKGRAYLLRLKRDHPKSSLRPKAHLLLGWMAMVEGDNRRARQELELLVNSYPKAPATDKARQLLAGLALRTDTTSNAPEKKTDTF